ncbi:hypothetical protein CORC01_06167 [Colletotrichum orchidophilum]|uniref:Secreted protein n=1 Tax=Colletotrichum orchidophilum TaxID=1209926 RepID=A0A1G4BB54_9PEZI|nr:uncharacterized protein CORC01_06167 [Colletotrichum orchidophilum]OHE98546.1 hypothetical protein CORC01_06167 [Colletotrichum orchidophilum]
MWSQSRSSVLTCFFALRTGAFMHKSIDSMYPSMPWSDHPPVRPSTTHDDGRSGRRKRTDWTCPSVIRYPPGDEANPHEDGWMCSFQAPGLPLLLHWLRLRVCDDPTPPHVKICTWSQVPYLLARPFLLPASRYFVCTRQNAPFLLHGGWTTSIAHGRNKPRGARTAPNGGIRRRESVRNIFHWQGPRLRPLQCGFHLLQGCRSQRPMYRTLWPLKGTWLPLGDWKVPTWRASVQPARFLSIQQLAGCQYSTL